MAKKTLLDNIIESIKDVDGRLIKQSGTTKQMISDLNYKVVAPAKSAADSAVSAADAAIASAQVTSDAVSAIASATAEAKQGANDAMSRAKSAWDVAIGAKSAVTDFDPLLKSAQSDAGKALTQIADTANALSDAKTQFGSDVAAAKELANTAQTTADSAVAVASDASSNATVAIQTASGASLTATNAQGDATIAKQTASEAKVQASNAESDFAQLSIRANKIEANVANNSGAIASVQQTATGLTTTVAKLNARDGINLLQGTSATENEGPSDFSGIAVTAGDNYTFSGFMSSTSISGVIAPYIRFHDGSGTKLKEFAKNSNVPVASGTSFVVTGVAPANAVTAHVFLAKSDSSITLNYRSLKFEHGSQATPWTPAPTDASVVYNSLKVTVDQTSNIINDPKTGLNATYQTAQGNASTISNVKGDVTQLQTTANGLTSRVGSLESKTATQQTAIEQNKNAIALKADQTNVDTLKGNVTDLQAKITTQANEIENKVTRSDVTGMLTGYATQNYTQSLVTQKANDWNLNLTSLKTDVNAIKTTGGGVNLLQGTRDFEQWGTSISKVAVTNGQETFQAATGTQNSSSSYFDLIVFGNVPLEKDTDYTASFWVKTSENVNICSFLFNSGSNGNYADGATTNQSTTDYTRVVVHFHNGNNTATPNFIPVRINKAGVTVWLYGCMLEKGTVAHDWSPAPSDMATVTSVTNLSATVDGIKSTVATKADQSTVTELSNLVQTKVSSGDYNSQITQLNNAINQRVQVGDVISQINQEAGGNTLIQVSNGKGSLILDANNTIITGKAWIPDAALSSVSADKIMLGSTSLWNSDGTLNLVNSKDGITSKITVTQGSVNFDGTNKTASIIQFASDNNTNAFTVNPTGATVTPTLFFERFDQTPGHWLGFTRNDTEHEGVMFHTWDDSAERFFVDCHARFDKNLRTIGTLSQGSWDGTTAKPEAGVLTIKSGNTIWSGSDFLAVGSNVTGTYTGIWAKSFSQQSTLSSKTNIETVDPKDALDLINKTDIRSYQYKSDVAEGHTKRYTSLIIDDVNDVSQYYAPDEFINEERTGRDDGSAVGYLFLAVQELTRRIKTLEEKLNE